MGNQCSLAVDMSIKLLCGWNGNVPPSRYHDFSTLAFSRVIVHHVREFLRTVVTSSFYHITRKVCLITICSIVDTLKGDLRYFGFNGTEKLWTNPNSDVAASN